jgi:hydroxymethylglutaryl-CoA lyase|tara:strand:+ start:1150 stop:2067 length:918 start_codon:yes stop_codon:yes gene_type:complete
MTDLATVREVGLRDGLQLVKRTLPTDIKIEWCQTQAACGFREMEVTSFVPPKVIPQFADAESVLKAAQSISNMRAAVLVPNLKWGLQALDHGAKKITFVLSVSEAHNMANVRRTTDTSIAEFSELIAERNCRGLQDSVMMSVALATTFGCSLQGEVAEPRVYNVAEQVLMAGAQELNMADTVGYGNPIQVKRIFTEILQLADKVQVAAHFHDTRGMGLANAVAALEAGVREFDASLGGLGGCPFAKGASGNIATEDCVYLLESLGFATGINILAMLEVRKNLKNWLPDEPLEGKLLKAGLAATFE